MLRIRLRRVGAKHKPYYRIVVSESARTPGGRFNAVLGTYDPGKDPAEVKLDVAKADEWVRKGAHPSETVAKLIERARRATAGAPV